MTQNVLNFSPFQERVLRVPEQFDLILPGGRGGGKSYSLAQLALRHVEQYKEKARVLYVRLTHKGTEDFSSLLMDLLPMVYGKGARFNASDGFWKISNGGYIELNQLETAKDYSKFQGRSFSLLLIDEAGQYPVPDLLDKLKSNLRGPLGMPIRTVLAANPGDPGHHWIAQRYIFKSAPWVPFLEEKSQRQWVCCPSTYRDNIFIDQQQYQKQLAASCPSDPELLRSWLLGDWSISRGAFFASVLSEDRNAIDPWPGPPEVTRYSQEWLLYLAHDYGSSAPSVTYIVGKSPGCEGPDGKFYPRDSIVLIDELATNTPDSLTQGLNWTVPILAESICQLAKRWKMPRAEGTADPACFSQHGHAAGSIADEFARENVYFLPAQKSTRVAGWEKMRRMLQAAGEVDSPGLYVSRACEYFWATVPYLGRDPKRIEDLDSRSADHAADCARYALLRRERTIQQIMVADF